MLFSTLLAATAATLASASPLKPQDLKSRDTTSNYTYAVTTFTFGGTSAAAAVWSFNVSAAASSWGPGFPSVFCEGNTLEYDYVPCTTINDDQVVSAYIENGILINLFVKYELLDGEARYDFVGNTTAVSNYQCDGCSEDYTIDVTNVTAVA